MSHSLSLRSFGHSHDLNSLFGIRLSRPRRILGTLLVLFVAWTVRSDNTNCCITSIQFVQAKGEKGLKIEAYTDTGLGANNNGFTMHPAPKPTNLRGFSARKVTIRV